MSREDGPYHKVDTLMRAKQPQESLILRLLHLWLIFMKCQ